MTALFPMSEAKRDGTRVLGFPKWGGTMLVVRTPESYERDPACDYPLLGFLPLPASAESADVAKAAGEWLSVCQPEDVADVIRTRLADEAVRDELLRATPLVGAGRGWRDADGILQLIVSAKGGDHD